MVQSGSGYAYKGMSLESMIRAAVNKVAAKRILSVFCHELKTMEKREEAASRSIDERKPGMTEVVQILATGSFPEILELLSKLLVALQTSSWGMYLRLAIPLVPGLPLLLYVGSSCAMSLPVGGLAARAYKHVYNGRPATKCEWIYYRASSDVTSSDDFALGLLNDPDLNDPDRYGVVFLEAWAPDDFQYLTAPRAQLTEACVLSVIAERVFADIFDGYNRNSVLKTKSPRHSKSTKSCATDMLSTSPRHSRAEIRGSGPSS